MPTVIAAVPLAASTSNLPGSETTVFSLSSYASTLYGFITLSGVRERRKGGGVFWGTGFWGTGVEPGT